MTDVYGTNKNIGSEPSRDDLTKIKGIGTITADRLYNAKILTVKQVAEMTPESLSETPGVGLTTAKKYIDAAKAYLSGSQREGITEISSQVDLSLKDESSLETIENYEIAEVIVEENEEFIEKSNNEFEESVVASLTDQKWFSDKYSYSRLTASYPPMPESIKNIKAGFEEEEDHVIESDKKPIMEQINEFEAESLQENVSETEIEIRPELKNNVKEEEKIDYPIEEANIIHLEDSIGQSIEGSNHQHVSNLFKDLGCYEIPNLIESLEHFTINLDYLGCKLVKASNDFKILFLFPVKWFNHEGTVLVDETKLELKSHTTENDFGAYGHLEQLKQSLLQVRDSMYEDIVNHHNIRDFFQNYLQISLSLATGFGNKSFVYLSGSNQYRVVIEPILICNNPPRSMEKSLAFPYQRRTNLHVVARSDIASLITFLEKKYRMIEKRTKKTNSIKNYQQSEEKFRSSVKYASIPIFGYSVALLAIYFTELYFLLRLLNTIGFAVLGIYISLLALFYFNFNRTKTKFAVQIETPYYLQNLEFSEIDLLDFKSELTDDLMTQFGYECIGKAANFRVIKQSETNTLKNNLEVKRHEPEIQNMFEPKRIKVEAVMNSTTKYDSKYLSFLEDP